VDTAQRWSPAQAAAWQQRVGWLVGCNFVPSSAASQLEMWQAESFDPATIERELGFAASLGLNSLRVFLHDLLWQQDADAFLARLDRFLGLAGARGIGVVPVLFDGVWDPRPKPGPQPPPRPHVHNSRWVQGPGAAVLGTPERHAELEPYVTGVLARFGGDPRIHAWDLFNEPDNPNPAYAAHEIANKAEMATLLLGRTFAWARKVGPSQPLTCGVWLGDWSREDTLRPIERLALERSDVISFHWYGDLESTAARVGHLRRFARPILCTEWMARPLRSTFDPLLRFFRDENVGAYHWGLVSGRSQTIHSWASWTQREEGEPARWFHDVLRPDGTPYDPAEIATIQRVTGVG
jgi:hypothetical protein